MAYSSKLCNPTPFKVDLPWHRGISIPVEPFGETVLEMQQMDDFRPGKPGSADVKSVLDYHGLFLYDTDRPYDNQALEALQRSHRAKKAQYEAAVKNLRVERAKSGIPPEEAAFDETLDQLGFMRLKKQVDTLEKAIKKFKTVVGDSPEKSMRPQFDPARTIMVMDPPRQFPSPAAMNFFLDENPEIKARHEAHMKESQVPSASTLSRRQAGSVLGKDTADAQ